MLYDAPSTQPLLDFFVHSVAVGVCHTLCDFKRVRGRRIHSVVAKEPALSPSTHTLRLWKALICAYSDADDMKGAAIPTALRDVGVVHKVMEAHCNAGEYEATVALFHELRADATQRADVLIFVSLLKALTALSALSFGREIHCELRVSKMVSWRGMR